MTASQELTDRHEHIEHRGHHHGAPTPATAAPAEHDALAGWALTKNAVSATTHCLTGCAVGEVLGLVIGTALGWGSGSTVAVAVALAFFFGYALTIRPVISSGVPLRTAVHVALAADTASITVMEIVDNVIIVAVPGAMDAGLRNPLFWGSLAISLATAFAATVPVNRWLIGRGRGHATAHGYHH